MYVMAMYVVVVVVSMFIVPSPSFLLQRRREGIVNRAEVEPSLLDDLSIRSALTSLGIFGKDNCETGFEMPIDVAKKPVSDA